MPISIKDFTWEESLDRIFITLPLKGVKSSNVNIFSTEEYLKVHYSPYLFECFFYAPVHDQQSSVQIGNGVVVFKIEKKQEEIWTQLQHPDAGNKQAQNELRQKAVRRSQERSEEQHQQKARVKRETDTFGVQKQMKLEEEEHQRIEMQKEMERQQANNDLELWKQQQQLMAEQEAAQRLEQSRITHTEKDKELLLSQQGAKDLAIEERKANIFIEEAVPVDNTELRKAGKISVNFTPRTFPTPSRESTADDEQAWLKKQVDARRVADLDDADLSEEERNPVWLQNKGISFFKAGNIQAAINVFTHAIRLDSKMPSLYSNRAACHLRVSNHFKCAEDCSKALELLTPPVPQNAKSRCKAHVRRGTAYCQLELYAEGLQDYEAALKLEPDNAQLIQDAERIRSIIQSTSAKV